LAYVGQTKRKLNTRIAEHKRNKKGINKNTFSHSIITEYRIEFDHDFDRENPKILDIKKHYLKRLMSKIMKH